MCVCVLWCLMWLVVNKRKLNQMLFDLWIVDWLRFSISYPSIPNWSWCWCVVWTQNINYYSDQPPHSETYNIMIINLGHLGSGVQTSLEFWNRKLGPICWKKAPTRSFMIKSLLRHYGNILRNIVDSFSYTNTRGQRTEITAGTLRLHTGAKEEQQEAVAFNIWTPRSSAIRRMFWNS